MTISEDIYEGEFIPNFMILTDLSVQQATLYATVSASFTIEQEGLPSIKYTSPSVETWNGDEPLRRLEVLRKRQNNPN